jgi:hypothetical protein
MVKTNNGKVPAAATEPAVEPAAQQENANAGAEQEPARLSNKQKFVSRFKKLKPDLKDDDEEGLYGVANEALDKYDNDEAQRSRLNKIISSSKIAPELLQGMLSGKNADGTDFDLEDYLLNKNADYFLDYIEDHEGAKKKLKDRKAQREREMAEEAEFKKNEGAKLKKEDSELDAAISAMGYKEDQVKDLIDWIYDPKKGLIARAGTFDLTKDDFIRLFKLKDYDVQIAQAESKGYKRGKNEKIDMFSHKQNQRKNMPPDLGTGGTKIKSQEKKDKTLEALEKMKNAYTE